MRIVQLMTHRSRYFNPSKNYWFSVSAFLTDILKYMLLVDLNNINVPGQRIFFHTFLCRYPGQMQRLLQINCHYIFLLICYFCILMYNIPTRIFTDLYLKSKRQHFRVFVYKSNFYFS
jgi:hypothetical protein